MSEYVNEKVLRVPLKKYDISRNELEDKLMGYYAHINKFEIAPTETDFLDYILEYEYGCDHGEFGKCRELTDDEKEKYYPLFVKMIKQINMDDVRLVEFGWYNCTEAPDYYDELSDGFYDEV